ncbi:MAG TPA: peptidylprolyl isomerase [Nitriliruptorales bacterium]|nr:peptidylprolyl isomerase [Nitriliruptorales bacterium]
MTPRYPAPPPMQIDPQLSYTATLTTSEGAIHIDLFAARSPGTVNNFVFLAHEGFYQDVIFHRVIDGFMIQGGDPTGTGTGGPGYRFADELQAARELGYPRGTVAMANAGPDTNGSQFFIVHRDAGLPPDYAVFGHVTDGMPVVDRIAARPTDARDRPLDDVRIERVTITES